MATGAFGFESAALNPAPPADRAWFRIGPEPSVRGPLTKKKKEEESYKDTEEVVRRAIAGQSEVAGLSEAALPRLGEGPPFVEGRRRSPGGGVVVVVEEEYLSRIGGVRRRTGQPFSEEEAGAAAAVAGNGEASCFQSRTSQR
ncbi:hypothetical protein NL676_036244 [Syzygium grande]|nr:hypothetical protein NL676_036244 [Syzygium grande]